MKFPDFIGLGTQRSGTTSLYNYLCQHFQVIPNNYKKEVKYWNYVYNKGLNWYKNCFPDEAGKITGDVTSNYFWYVDPEIMYVDLPATTKLMVILRNPVDRMHSFYWWLKQRYPCEKHPIRNTFEESIEAFIDESNYIKYLKKWVDVFGRNRILVIITEELVKLKPIETWNEICDYLEIKRDYYPDINKKWVSQNYTPMKETTRKMLIETFRAWNDELGEYLGNDLSFWNKGD